MTALKQPPSVVDKTGKDRLGNGWIKEVSRIDFGYMLVGFGEANDFQIKHKTKRGLDVYRFGRLQTQT